MPMPANKPLGVQVRAPSSRELSLDQTTRRVSSERTAQQSRKLSSTWIDFGAIRVSSTANALAICRRLLPGGRLLGREYSVTNPKRPDKSPGSFRINVQTGRWADFATGEAGGDIISLVAWLCDVRQAEAARRLANMLSIKLGEVE